MTKHIECLSLIIIAFLLYQVLMTLEEMKPMKKRFKRVK